MKISALSVIFLMFFIDNIIISVQITGLDNCWHLCRWLSRFIGLKKILKVEKTHPQQR